MTTVNCLLNLYILGGDIAFEAVDVAVVPALGLADDVKLGALALTDLSDDRETDSGTGTEIDPLAGAVPMAEPFFPGGQILAADVAAGAVDVAVCPAVFLRDHVGLSSNVRLEEHRSVRGLPDVDLLPGDPDMGGGANRLRNRNRKSVPAGRADDARKISGAGVLIHTARDPGDRTGRGILVNVPGEGGVEDLPVIGEPFGEPVGGGPVNIVGEPVGVGIDAGEVPGLLEPLAEGDADLGDAVFSEGRLGIVLDIEIDGELELLAGESPDKEIGFPDRFLGRDGIAVPVGPAGDACGLAAAVVGFKGGVELTFVHAVARAENGELDSRVFDRGPVDASLMFGYVDSFHEFIPPLAFGRTEPVRCLSFPWWWGR